MVWCVLRDSPPLSGAPAQSDPGLVYPTPTVQVRQPGCTGERPDDVVTEHAWNRHPIIAPLHFSGLVKIPLIDHHIPAFGAHTMRVQVRQTGSRFGFKLKQEIEKTIGKLNVEYGLFRSKSCDESQFGRVRVPLRLFIFGIKLKKSSIFSFMHRRKRSLYLRSGMPIMQLTLIWTLPHLSLVFMIAMELNLTSNLLSGTIPDEISQLPRLQRLFLSHNSLSGPIPAAVGQFQHLGLLDLSNNKFSSEIPKSLGNLVQINSMFLNNNLLSGSIPSSLGQCRDLYTLDLSYNNLTGNIPLEISGLREMRIFINLSHNLLEGDLPIELSKLENVQEMDLSSNRFTGRVFPRISSCIALSLLNISHNLLEGELPESLGDLKNLKVFDVSGNGLSGTIPKSLSNIHTLTFLNLSVNQLSGTIPSGGIFDSVTYLSFLSNRNLCGPILGIPKCHKSTKKRTTFLIIFGIVSLPVAFLAVRYLKVVIFAGKAEPETEPQPEWIDFFPRITYKELFDATGGFDEQRKLGSGSSGCVYRGVLPDGTCIAVKVLQLQTGSPAKIFNRECQVLKSIRHRNLIRIITTCSLPDFKALVLPFMANGSLDSLLYPHSGTGLSTSGSSGLTLIQRVNICSNIAEGMAYLHHHSPVRVIHRDLNPSNVLLNDNMTALVSDFGIARLVMTVGGGNNCQFYENVEKSSTNRLCGSIGYIAPEYGLGSAASIKGDVYSFGIIVLEMVTRKRPTDDMFTEGLSLPRWVKNHYNGRIERVVDSSLVKAMRDQSPEEKKMWEVAIEELAELGILCTLDSPSTRPTMLDAADDLARLKHRLKRYPSGDTTATSASSNGTLR
ncbi:putative leucine-rich repeat receptor-like serine/threonine-protein kinase At2g24130 [Rhododendron vialii]|uniref:putative leucine-rich repeat receptor-like serine/threonine-protein kinase At2g24130 n=1 Tax=Rhododendron vialii TaxID=182163 RepID=UPI0026600A53|nr:putative leucine-rich repeat receptor-like serine/threonine-protein kinase At2g24130 [Rhododendron vialii]